MMRSTVNSTFRATDAQGSGRTGEGLSDGSSLWPMQRDASTTARSPGSGTRARSSSVLGTWPAGWIGPLATVAAAGLIVIARPFVTVASPGLILLVFVAVSAVLAGVRPALLSAGVAALFAIVNASGPGAPFSYDAAAMSSIVVAVSTALAMALLVGSRFERLDVPREVAADEPGDDRGSAALQAAGTEAPNAPDATRSAEHEPPVAHETILVAEDEAVVREMVVAALERLHYRVVVASTGEEAVRLIDRLGDDIDLLLSDVVMPGMSGLDLYDRALRVRPDLKAIFMSGYTALAIGRKIPDGITLLEKPFSAARLNDVVRATLGST
jgi:CheY-like chemotaxis protein